MIAICYKLKFKKSQFCCVNFFKKYPGRLVKNIIQQHIKMHQRTDKRENFAIATNSLAGLSLSTALISRTRSRKITKRGRRGSIRWRGTRGIGKARGDSTWGRLQVVINVQDRERRKSRRYTSNGRSRRYVRSRCVQCSGRKSVHAPRKSQGKYTSL